MICSAPANGTRPGVVRPFDKERYPMVLRWKANGSGTRSRILPSFMSTETSSGILPGPSTRKNFGRIQVGKLLIHSPFSTRCISQSVTHRFCVDSKATLRAFSAVRPDRVVDFTSGSAGADDAFAGSSTSPAITSRCRSSLSIFLGSGEFERFCQLMATVSAEEKSPVLINCSMSSPRR